jgi:hypothetical protein
MKKLLLTLALLSASLSRAQVPSPQIPLTGNIGSGGVFPLLNSGKLVFATDANHTMAYPEMSAYFIQLTSSVSLTATRNLVAPMVMGFMFAIENETTGGQAIRIIGPSGTGVTIANGQTATVYCDGTNYVNAFPPYVSNFGSITSGTNTQAAMVIDSGASLDYVNSGTVNASSIAGVAVTGTPSSGQVLTATGPSAADWEDGGGSMVYPGAGVANSTGTAWGTSYVVGTSANDLVQLNSSAALPAVSGANLTSLNGANLQSGTVANGALANSSMTVNSQTCTLGSSCTVAAVASLSGGALGSAPYQSAANATAFIASPTTASTTFLYGWQPSGSAIAPSALSLTTLLASPPPIGGTTANTGAFSTLTATQETVSGGSAGNVFTLTSASTVSTGFHVVNTTSGGKDYGFFVNGSGSASPGVGGLYDYTDTKSILTWNSSYLTTATGIGLCSGASDTCLVRSAAGIFNVGNGGATDKSGSMNMTSATMIGTTPLTLGPTSSYSVAYIDATNPSTGTATPIITMSAGSPNFVAYGSYAATFLESASGQGGGIGDGTRVDIAWDGTANVTFPQRSVGSGSTGNTDLDGEVTLVSGSYTYTFAIGHTVHPICTASDVSTSPIAIGVTYGGSAFPSKYTVTFSDGASGTETVDYMCLVRN